MWDYDFSSSMQQRHDRSTRSLDFVDDFLSCDYSYCFVGAAQFPPAAMNETIEPRWVEWKLDDP